MFKRKPKNPKPQAIQNYKVAYLDKRSRSYHKIVMTSFIGVFGLAGSAYLFSSGASNADATGKGDNEASFMLLAAALVLTAGVLLFSLFLVFRNSRK